MFEPLVILLCRSLNEINYAKPGKTDDIKQENEDRKPEDKI
jgi:hypothetical protein